MSDCKKLFDTLASCVGPAPLPYVCRIYMHLSVVPLSILSSNSRVQVILSAVNERFKTQYTLHQIRTLTNLIAMNLSFVRNVFLTDLAYSNATVDINDIMIDVLHDELLLPFTTTCIYCQQALTVHSAKLVHIS